MVKASKLIQRFVSDFVVVWKAKEVEQGNIIVIRSDKTKLALEVCHHKNKFFLINIAYGAQLAQATALDKLATKSAAKLGKNKYFIKLLLPTDSITVYKTLLDFISQEG